MRERSDYVERPTSEFIAECAGACVEIQRACSLTSRRLSRHRRGPTFGSSQGHRDEEARHRQRERLRHSYGSPIPPVGLSVLAPVAPAARAPAQLLLLTGPAGGAFGAGSGCAGAGSGCAGAGSGCAGGGVGVDGTCGVGVGAKAEGVAFSSGQPVSIFSLSSRSAWVTQSPYVAFTET